MAVTIAIECGGVVFHAIAVGIKALRECINIKGIIDAVFIAVVSTDTGFVAIGQTVIVTVQIKMIGLSISIAVDYTRCRFHGIRNSIIIAIHVEMIGAAIGIEIRGGQGCFGDGIVQSIFVEIYKSIDHTVTVGINTTSLCCIA